MDSDRLKGGGSILTNEFFERQLEKIREIRLSEERKRRVTAQKTAPNPTYEFLSHLTRNPKLQAGQGTRTRGGKENAGL